MVRLWLQDTFHLPFSAPLPVPFSMPVLSCTVTDCWIRELEITSTKQNCRLVFDVIILLNQLLRKLGKYCCLHKEDVQMAERGCKITFPLYHGFECPYVDYPGAPLALLFYGIYGTLSINNSCISEQWGNLWTLPLLVTKQKEASCKKDRLCITKDILFCVFV